MKKDIHPEYIEKAKITCACGASYDPGSTQGEIQVELCAACHPFYTGTQKIVDTARRVEKFHAKMKKAEGMDKTGKAAKKAKRSAKKDDSDQSDEVKPVAKEEAPAVKEEAPAVKEELPVAETVTAPESTSTDTATDK